MSFTHRPILSRPGYYDLPVHALHVTHRVNVPARAEVTVALPEVPDADSLRAWFGSVVTLDYKDGDASIETWRVAGLDADERLLTVQLCGVLAQLQHGHSAIALSNASLLDCACTLLDRYGVSAQVDVSDEAATTPVALLMQPEIDDLTFLVALVDAGGFCMVDTLDDYGVALIDTAACGEATVTPLAGTATSSRLQVIAGSGRPLAASIVTDRTRDSLSVGQADTTVPAIRSGVSLDPEALRVQLDARAARSSTCLTYHVETRNTAARPGWQVDVDASWIGSPLSVQELSRHLDENQRVRTLLLLADPVDFTASGPEVPHLPLPAPRCARVVAPESEDTKGFITIALDGPEAEVLTPAQLTAQTSGTGNGASILPQPDAWVAVAFLGDPLMSRPVVIGTLRDAIDPPPQHDGTDLTTLILARSTAGSEVTFDCGDGGDSLMVRIGETSALALGADGQVTLEGDNITIDARVLTLKGSTIDMEQN